MVNFILRERTGSRHLTLFNKPFVQRCMIKLGTEFQLVMNINVVPMEKGFLFNPINLRGLRKNTLADLWIFLLFDGGKLI